MKLCYKHLLHLTNSCKDPIICVVLDQMKSFLKKLLARFIKASVIKAAEEAAEGSITTVAYASIENPLPSEL